MFTGIIESTAKILVMTDSGLTLARPAMFDDLKIGCSIAVSGVCLSVTAFDDASMSFDVVPTTFAKTKLGSLAVGDIVNLERALPVHGRLEGHIVLGHVEGVGEVVACSHSQALPPSPSPVPGEGNVDSKKSSHVWKGVSGLIYAPEAVIANARGMRKEPTEAEGYLWQKLRRRNVDGYYFRRQRPIGSFIVDFYCEELALAVEVDGKIHDEKNQHTFDQWRSEHLKLLGVHMLRFTNEQVMNHVDDVISAIKSFARSPLHSKGGGVGGGGTDGAVIAEDPGEVGVRAAEQGEARGGGTNKNGILKVRIPAHLMKYIVLHGSITLDGVALTVADLHDTTMTVAIIPHTQKLTTLGSVKKGDTLNIESDIVGKYILKAHGPQ